MKVIAGETENAPAVFDAVLDPRLTARRDKEVADFHVARRKRAPSRSRLDLKAPDLENLVHLDARLFQSGLGVGEVELEIRKGLIDSVFAGLDLPVGEIEEERDQGGPLHDKPGLLLRGLCERCRDAERKPQAEGPPVHSPKNPS
jgi:hypothetical protein